MITDEARKKMGWKRGRIFTAYEVECVICGKKFTTSPSQKNQYCCSNECRHERRKIQHVKYVCLFCGKDIYDIKRKAGGRKYCSRECKLMAFAKKRGEKPDDAFLWGKFRTYRVAKQELLKKYKKCMICGYNERLDILELHHKDRNVRNNTEENMILLCPNCHTIDHLDAKDGQFSANKGVKRNVN